MNKKLLEPGSANLQMNQMAEIIDHVLINFVLIARPRKMSNCRRKSFSH